LQYLLDTVTIIRHFSGKGKIGNQAEKILEDITITEDRLFISVISLVEILYLSEKNRIDINLQETIEKIKKSEIYSIVNLNADIVKTAETIKFYELHDRLILSTSKWLDIPIISSDKRFKEISEIKTIWN
jgi:PIN domain nuclease of toxin-antitoxin system